jgi:hypothetical protein
MPFGKWLAEIGLGRHEQIFASNEIDFAVIGSLTDADLRELGLPLGDRSVCCGPSPGWTGSPRPTLPPRPPKIRFRPVANAASSP